MKFTEKIQGCDLKENWMISEVLLILLSLLLIIRATKEYEIEGRYNGRGPTYHIIIHAL